MIIPTRAFAALLIVTLLLMASLRAAGVTLERIARPHPVVIGAIIR